MIDWLATRLARLSRREFWLLTLLFFVALPLAFIEGVARPLLARLDAARDAETNALALAAWLAVQQGELAVLPRSATNAPELAADRIGISGIEARLIEAELRGFANQLADTGTGGVTLRFDSVAFERLMPWLETTEAETGYRLTGLRLVRAEAEGYVMAEILLEPLP